MKNGMGHLCAERRHYNNMITDHNNEEGTAEGTVELLDKWKGRAAERRGSLRLPTRALAARRKIPTLTSRNPQCIIPTK